MAVPHPSENLHWPAWFYPPDADETNATEKGRVFQSADDVPEGWAHHWSQHGVGLNREPPPAPDPGLTRRELQAELTKRDIVFRPTDAKSVLQGLLDEAQAAEALDESV